MRASVLVFDSSPVFRRGAQTVLAEAGVSAVGVPDEQHLSRFPDSGPRNLDHRNPDHRNPDHRRDAARRPDAERIVCLWGLAGEAADLAMLGRWVAQRPGWAFLAVAGPGSTVDVMAVLGAGANGVIDRDVEEIALVEAVRTVRAGNPVLQADPRGGLWRAMASSARSPVPELTRRENQVLQALARGLTNRAIADELVISENTVKNHVRRLFEKLGVRSRTEAVIRGAREGIVSVGDHEPSPGAAP